MKPAWICAALVLGLTAFPAAQKNATTTNNAAAHTQGVSENGSTEQILAAQKELKRRGYFVGGLDGIMGPKTRKAINLFQGVEALPQTGELDSATLRKLHISETATTSSQAGKNVGEQGAKTKTNEQTNSQGAAVGQPQQSPSTPK